MLFVFIYIYFLLDRKEICIYFHIYIFNIFYLFMEYIILFFKDTRIIVPKKIYIYKNYFKVNGPNKLVRTFDLEMVI